MEWHLLVKALKNVVEQRVISMSTRVHSKLKMMNLQLLLSLLKTETKKVNMISSDLECLISNNLGRNKIFVFELSTLNIQSLTLFDW